MSAIGQDGAPGGTSANDAPGNDAGQGFNFEQGYQALRPEYTRVTQELGQTRDRLSEFEKVFADLHDSDPEVQAAAMEALGLELDTGPASAHEDDDFVDPLEREVQQLRQTVERLSNGWELEAQTREQQQLESMRDDFIGEAIGIIEGSVNVKFTEREESVLGNLAIAMADENGVPDVQAAYNILYGDESFLEDNRQRWIDSKSGAAVPPLGTSIPADKKPQTRADRIAYFDERVAQIENQQ